MDLAFVNGPIHNGPFTFHDSPGKAVGLLIAEALNHLLGNPVARHLWNCATLANDLRHHPLRKTLARADFEADQIRRKYSGSAWDYTAVETATDTDLAVRALAFDMIEDRIATGALEISRETIRVCAQCDHMVGFISPPACAACRGNRFLSRKQPHLVAQRLTGRPVLDHTDLYGTVDTKHLRATAAQSPERLLLSRTRDHGIGLDRIGLPGLVLDARAAVHITALAEARLLGAARAVMTATPKAIANIAAYGFLFRSYEGTWLRYGPHSRVPASAVNLANVDPADHRRMLFRRWFVPLVSLGRTADLHNAQLSAVFTHFRRAWLRRTEDTGYRIRDIHEAIRSGDHRWIMDKRLLSAALRTGIAVPTS